MEHVYNGKENTKYLKLLKQNYSSSQAVIREIVNLTAITNLPKGTEFFLSDIHGEYDLYNSGKYQNNTGIQPSLMYKDFEK